MSSSHSYDTYFYWSIIPPFVGSGIVLLGVVVLIKVSAILKCNRCRSSQYFVNPLFHVVKVIFGDHINKTKGSQKFTFYRYEVSLLQIFMFSTITLMVFGPTFMSFWVSFIANETFVCDPQLDCFLRDPSTFDVFSSEPLDNCTSYDSTNGTVVCLEFIFDLSKGFSSAVGYMSVAVVYCRLYTFIMIWLQEFCSDKCQKNCTRCVFWIIPVIIIPVISVFIFILSGLVPFFSDVVLKTNKSIIIFYAYMISFAYIGPMAGLYVSVLVGGARKVRTIGARKVKTRGVRNVRTSNNAQVTGEKENPLLGASVNRSNYTNLPQDT